MTTVAEEFGKLFKDVKFDRKLARAVYKYQIGYINSNREYLEFYGSNLLGVHVIRFKDSDIYKLFDEVLDIDYMEVDAVVKSLPNINQNFKISSDTFNLVVIYLVHRFLTSKILGDNDRHRAAYDCSLLFYYRTLAALMSYYFKYPADPKIAQVAYSNLSNKYLIKRLGSWSKVVDYRTKDLVDKKGLHYKNMIKFNDDLELVKILNDAQGRLRDMIKNYYIEFKAVHESGESIINRSATMLDLEGNEIIRDKITAIDSSLDYILNIVIDEHSFIKNELVEIIYQINKNTSPRMLKLVLKWIHDNYGDSKYHDQLTKLLKLTIIVSYGFIDNQIRPANYRDYPNLLVGLKNLHLSSRSTDKDLLELREICDDIIRKSSHKKISESLMISTRTAVILYITFRSLIGKNK